MTPELQSALGTSRYVGAWETDVAAQTVELTGRVADLLGIERRRAAAGVPIATFLEGVHPADREDVAERVHQAHRGPSAFDAEFRTGGSSRDVRVVLARGQVVPKLQGPGLRCFGIVMDVTESLGARQLDAATQAALIGKIVDALVEVHPLVDQVGSAVLRTLIDAALFELGTQLAKGMKAELSPMN